MACHTELGGPATSVRRIAGRLAVALLALTLACLPASARETLKLATIAPGSSAYLVMSTFAGIVNRAQDRFTITVDATGVATKHGVDLAEGKLDLAMTSPTLYAFLQNGQAMYATLPDPAGIAARQRLLLWFPYGQYHVVAHDESGIRNLADLRGKRVFLGPPGGGARVAALGWIKSVTGLDPANGDYTEVNASWSSALHGFQDRQFDVYVNGGIAPFPQVELLALSHKVRLIGLSPQDYAALPAAQDYIADVPGAELGVIRKGVYGANVVMEHDIHTLGAAVGIMVQAAMPADTAYLLTASFWQNVPAAQADAPWLAGITLPYAVHDGDMPLHPGALRYYRETGVAVPEGSLPD